MRKIVHIDMDAFYASVEQRDNPQLRGKPLVVAKASKRGVVAAASYEARKYGIRSAMPVQHALQLCPYLIFAQPRFDVYQETSKVMHEIFLRYTSTIEPLSLDEAYMDVTDNYIGEPSATRLAQRIKRKLFHELRLNSSAGISFNKFLAKVASGYQKPNGFFTIPPERGQDFIDQLSVEHFWGVGPATLAKMHSLNIFTGDDLKACSEGWLRFHFGKAGSFFYQLAHGNDPRRVETYRERKSIGKERTFETDLIASVDKEEIRNQLQELVAQVALLIQQKGFDGQILTFKWKNRARRVFTRSMTFDYALQGQEQIMEGLEKLLPQLSQDEAVRLLGVSVSVAERQESHQLLLF